MAHSLRVLLLLLLAGCASPDDLRVVHPIQWYELERVDLAIMCRDKDVKGCVVSRAEGDSIYVRSCKP